MITPTRENFLHEAKKGQRIPIFREVFADRITPVLAFEKITTSEDGTQSQYAFLLDSVTGGERIGRYSYLGSDPRMVFRSKGRKIWIVRGSDVETLSIADGGDPLTHLKALLHSHEYVANSAIPRFCGGAVGIFGYDVVRFFENLPDKNPDDLEFDDACFMFTDTLLIFDNVKNLLKVVCLVEVGEDAAQAYDDAATRIEGIIERLRSAALPSDDFRCEQDRSRKVERKPLFPKEQYLAAVEQCREYILAGDAFQVVLSQRFEVEFSAPAFHLYRALRSVNPSPYMFYLSLGGRKIIGSSPEILVTLDNRQARLRPIAGTRPRGMTEEEDRLLEKELLADEKERAEHIMLVDLSRNDLGRVCKYGTVKVNELMIIERYSHVMHIVSDVTGQLVPEKDAFDLLRAVFPHGTVSGAPKVRAMEIIDELEPTRRGFYSGSVGYLSYSGDMDMAIAIRTMLIEGNKAYLQSGGGLVADSQPEAEYIESINKSQALVSAIQIAEQGLD